MTISLENDNDVIVYPFERVIDYARSTQLVFVAQFVWWLASIIELAQGLIIHIDNLRKKGEVKESGRSGEDCNIKDKQQPMKSDSAIRQPREGSVIS